MTIYGGQIIDLQGDITFNALNKILDMLDRYIELIEQVGGSQ